MDNECGYEEKVFLYLDGMIDDEGKREVEEHLSSCQWCREQAALLSNIQGDFHRGIQVPSDFTSKVLEKIDMKSRQHSILPAVMAGILFILVFLLTGSQAPSPQTGTVISSLFSVIKNLHVTNLLSQTLTQNMHFIASYITAISALVLYTSIMKSRRSPGAINGAHQ
ncbi:MAG: zf-HC2 domain-containing protein [Candidatus Eremiobacteraeota bacterium]|nr:zf-HC2 domain-containing protein [Candidatus Eremiobacteraeota bacterium]